HATLVRAFAEVVRADPGLESRLRLAIVGDGPRLQELRSLARSLGVAELAWFPGALTNVPEVLRTFDVFVLPSLSEGISNTILEAMATQLPVLATAVGGNTELIEDGSNGRLFKPGDVATLALMLRDYVKCPSRCGAHANAARQGVVERFSLD